MQDCDSRSTYHSCSSKGHYLGHRRYNFTGDNDSRSEKMLIKEYRIPLPLSVEEYRIAQLYMIAVSILVLDTEVSNDL